VQLTLNEAGSAGLYVGGTLLGTAATMSANTPNTLAVAEQAALSTASLVVTDLAGNAATASGVVLLGSAGADTMTGSANNDLLFGYASNDTLNGGAGDDQLHGGAGSDTFVWSSGNDVIHDFETTTTIDFEGLVARDSVDQIPNGYMGLDWDNAGAIGDQLNPSSGYPTALNSGTTTAYDMRGAGLAFSDAAQDFDFLSGYFAAAWNNDNTVSVIAYDDGAEVGRATFRVDQFTRASVDFANATATGVDSGVGIDPVFTGRFTSIDRVSIDGSGSHLSMDDLIIRRPIPIDRIDLATGTDINALLATATDDGAGNARLTLGADTLTLIGIDYTLIDASWFV